MKNSGVITDEARLISGCKNNETQAQKRVYELYASAMFAVCMRYVNDYETAKDILQDGFIKVFTKIDDYTGDGFFSGWVKRIFINTALEYLRQNDVNRELLPIDSQTYQVEDEAVTIVERMSADDLMACVASLPDGYRTVFNLYAIEGYSHQEIAEMLSISENTSRSQFMRARKLLQQKVQEIG